MAAGDRGPRGAGPFDGGAGCFWIAIVVIVIVILIWIFGWGWRGRGGAPGGPGPSMITGQQAPSSAPAAPTR